MNICAKEKVTVLTLELDYREIEIFKEILYSYKRNSMTSIDDGFKLAREILDKIKKL